MRSLFRHISAFKAFAAETRDGGKRMETLNRRVFWLTIAATAAAVKSAVDGLTRLL